MAKFSRHWVILSIVLVSAVLAAQVNRKSVARISAVSPQVHAADMRLFDNRGSENLVEKADGLGEARVTIEVHRPLFPHGETAPAEGIKQMLCTANAVAVVSVLWPHPSLNKQQTWLFTEYEMRVVKVVKNNTARLLTPGQLIIVARSGGEIKTAKGHRIRLNDLSFPTFFTGQYLVFMHYFPATGHYVTDDPRGAFRVFGPHIDSLLDDKTLFQIGHKYNLSTLPEMATNSSCK